MPKNATIRKVFTAFLVASCLVAGGLSAPAANDPLVFSQIGSGIVERTAFRTVFRLSNEGSEAVAGQIDFTAMDGSSLQVQPVFRWSVDQSSATGIPEGGRALAEGSRIAFVVPSGHSLEIALTATRSLSVGRAVLGSEGFLNVQTLLQFAAFDGASTDPFDTRLIREVESHPVEGLRSFSFPVSTNSGGAVGSAVAIANLSAAEADVTLLLRPDMVFRRTLGPNAMMVGFLADLLGVAPEAVGAQNAEESPLQILQVNSAAPLGAAAFRTLNGLPLSGVSVARIPPEFNVVAETQLGEEFELAFGEAASIAEEGLVAAAANLIEDSRCPTGLVCVFEGQATVEVQLSKDGRRVGNLRLTSRAGQPDMAVDTLGSYRVELLEVSPYPDVETIPLKISDYRIRLRISRAD